MSDAFNEGVSGELQGSLSRRTLLQVAGVAGTSSALGGLASIGQPIAPASPNEPQSTEWSPEYEGRIYRCSIDEAPLVEREPTLADYRLITKHAALTQLGVIPPITCNSSGIYDHHDYQGNQFRVGAGVADIASGLLSLKTGKDIRDFEDFDFAGKDQWLGTEAVRYESGAMDIFVNINDITNRYHGLNLFTFHGAIFDGKYGYVQMAYPAPAEYMNSWGTPVGNVVYLSVSVFVGDYAPVESPNNPGLVKVFTIYPQKADGSQKIPQVMSYSIGAARLLKPGRNNQIYLNGRLERTRPLTVWEQAHRAYIGLLEGIQGVLPKRPTFEEFMFQSTQPGMIIPHELYPEGSVFSEGPATSIVSGFRNRYTRFSNRPRVT